MLNKIFEGYHGLIYPWGRNAAPEQTTPFHVANGVWWARFPMPISLDHINVWLLEDNNGWTVVDTCLATPKAQEIWQTIFKKFMGGKPVNRVICTHMHPDHIGLAGWICQQFDCELWMTREEYLTGQFMINYTGKEIPPEAIAFHQTAGYNNKQIAQFKQSFGTFSPMISPMPSQFRRIKDREIITIGDRYWQVIVGSGHSPEHACLYCPALKVLIAGDQVLPRITPNVSVFPIEPNDNPLAEWINSNEQFIDLLPNELLVLPAHQSPFTGLHVRANQVINNHRIGLKTIYKHLTEPKRVIDCVPILFGHKVSPKLFDLAVGETLANLNLLLHRGDISREQDADGVNWYGQSPDIQFESTVLT